MTMKSESDLSGKFKTKLPEQGWEVHSFESSLNKAIPDTYLVHVTKGYSAWVELKFEKGGAVEFQPGQVKWLESHEKRGGLGAVLLLSPGPSGGLLRLFPASSARWLSTARKLGERAEDLTRRAVVTGLPASPSLWEEVGAWLAQEAEDRWGRS
jgi:hypothetical protein